MIPSQDRVVQKQVPVYGTRNPFGGCVTADAIGKIDERCTYAVRGQHALALDNIGDAAQACDTQERKSTIQNAACVVDRCSAVSCSRPAPANGARPRLPAVVAADAGGHAKESVARFDVSEQALPSG